jgi:hypothetical protein
MPRVLLVWNVWPQQVHKRLPRDAFAALEDEIQAERKAEL